MLFCMREFRERPRSDRPLILAPRSAATAIPVTPSSMNYASVVFAGFSLIAAIWYFARGKAQGANTALEHIV